MTTFGKVLIGLMLATAAILVLRGGDKENELPIVVEEVQNEFNETDEMPKENFVEGKWNGSVNDLVARGGNYECTFTHSTDIADSTGTVFISGKKIRGDFSSTTKIANNTKIDSYMVSDGEFVYTWSSMVPTGFKASVNNANSDTESSTNSQSFDYNQKLDYDCKSWNVDPTKFIIPSDIKFTTI